MGAAPTYTIYTPLIHTIYNREGGQLPNPNKCNSILTNAMRGETLTPNPIECNYTLTSGTSVRMNLSPVEKLTATWKTHLLRIKSCSSSAGKQTIPSNNQVYGFSSQINMWIQTLLWENIKNSLLAKKRDIMS